MAKPMATEVERMAERPALIKGRGTPMTGSRPSAIPTLMKIWNASPPTMAMMTSIPERSGARRAPDRTGMLVIMAIVGGLAFQIFINVGMALGLLPVIGVPLPLMSAGLSSILATFIAIGFAISVQLRRFVN